MKIQILGDTHGEWEWIDAMYKHCRKFHGKVDCVLQVGDFGIGPWPEQPYFYDKPAHIKVPFHVVPGNHENYETLEHVYAGNQATRWEIARRPEVKYIGDVYTLCIGGADSVDKADRIPTRSWWWQEAITDEQIDQAVEMLKEYEPEMIVTHCCPGAFYAAAGWRFPMVLPSSMQLNKLLNEILYGKAKPPKLWLFGHYHTPAYIRYALHNDMYVLGMPLCSAGRRNGNYGTGYSVLDTDKREIKHIQHKGALPGWITGPGEVAIDKVAF